MGPAGESKQIQLLHDCSCFEARDVGPTPPCHNGVKAEGWASLSGQIQVNPTKSGFIVICFVRFGVLGIRFARLLPRRRQYLAVAMRVQGNQGKSRFIQPNPTKSGFRLGRDYGAIGAAMPGSCAEAYGTAGAPASFKAAARIPQTRDSVGFGRLVEVGRNVAALGGTGDRDGRGYDRIDRAGKPAGLVRFQVGSMMDPRGQIEVGDSSSWTAPAVNRSEVEQKTPRVGLNSPVSQRRKGCFLGRK